MDPSLTALLEPLRSNPTSSALLFDFDGTLAPVVDDPAAARAAPGVADLLDRRATQYHRVAVISGRPVSFLAEQLPPTVHLSGLYGLESLVDGVRGEHPDAPQWRPVVAAVTERALEATGPGTGLAGARVEPKGLSLTIHVRTRPDLEAGIAALADELATGSGLVVRAAKMSVELHPPIAADKGTAVRGLLDGVSHGLFAGDDLGDLAAFDGLTAERVAGRLVSSTLLVVGGPELPSPVRDRADLVLADPAALVEVLRALEP